MLLLCYSFFLRLCLIVFNGFVLFVSRCFYDYFHRILLEINFLDCNYVCFPLKEYLFKKINVLDKNKKLNCFWCSWNRRKILFETAGSIGCNKVALGHHKDDIIETTLLNLLFLGEFSTMNPRQELFRGKITIIRPLCHVEERAIMKFAKESGFPAQLYKCPNSQNSQRRHLKEFIKDIESFLSKH